MACGTYSGFSDVIAISGLKQRANKSINTSDLADDTFVHLVVACQVRQNSSHTSDNVDVG